MIVGILVFLWWLTGFVSFTYWWTKDFDLTVSVLLLAVWQGLIGPIAFVVGAAVHFEEKQVSKPSYTSKVLIKRRK